MKRFLLIFLLTICSLTSFGQVQTYRATSYAYADINTYSGQYTWSNWYQCSVDIVFDLQRDIVTIYSKSTQYYSVLSRGQVITDKSGGTQVAFKIVDQDNDIGIMRLRVERNGNSQLYIDFNNVGWVYNLVRTK